MNASEAMHILELVRSGGDIRDIELDRITLAARTVDAYRSRVRPYYCPDRERMIARPYVSPDAFTI